MSDDLEAGVKQCRKCLESKPLRDYYVHRGARVGADGIRRMRICRQCVISGPRTSPEKAFSYRLKSHYNITPKDYGILLAGQGGVCAICREPCATHGRLSVDHSHKTGAVRGLLCFLCNTALGKMRDDPANLAAAIVYLHGSGEALTPGDRDDFLAALQST